MVAPPWPLPRDPPQLLPALPVVPVAMYPVYHLLPDLLDQKLPKRLFPITVVCLPHSLPPVVPLYLG